MEVVYTSSNLTADAYIERFVADHRKDYDLTVASSDGLIQKQSLPKVQNVCPQENYLDVSHLSIEK